MENKLRLEIFPQKQEDLFNLLAKEKWLADFYLAGGTALALQIGHRKSVDFDFFTPKDFDLLLMKRRLSKMGEFELYSESEATLHGKLNSVEISYFSVPFPLIGHPIQFENIRIASKEDIAAMKLAVVAMRGTRKDFIDIYFLLKDFSLKQMYDFYVEKYGDKQENIYCSLKGLVYYEEADRQEMPEMFTRVKWQGIKKEIQLRHKDYIKALK